MTVIHILDTYEKVEDAPYTGLVNCGEGVIDLRHTETEFSTEGRFCEPCLEKHRALFKNWDHPLYIYTFHIEKPDPI